MAAGEEVVGWTWHLLPFLLFLFCRLLLLPFRSEQHLLFNAFLFRAIYDFFRRLVFGIMQPFVERVSPYPTSLIRQPTSSPHGELWKGVV